MHSVKEIVEDIELLAEMIEDNGIDTVKFHNGLDNSQIEEWERNNDSKLPQGYKDFIVLHNGFRYRFTQLLPLEAIQMVDETEQFPGYYIMGSYIGDGSRILSDKSGDFYYGDHAFGISKVDFSKFLEDDILQYMKEDLMDNDIEIPDDLNTKPTEEDKRKQEEEIAEMLRKLEALRAGRT